MEAEKEDIKVPGYEIRIEPEDDGLVLGTLKAALDEVESLLSEDEEAFVSVTKRPWPKAELDALPEFMGW